MSLMYISMYIRIMQRRYSIAEARANLPTLIDQAASGAHVELTRRGESVAVLISTQELLRLQGKNISFQEAYEAFRSQHDLKELGLTQKFVSKLRDRSPGRKVSL